MSMPQKPAGIRGTRTSSMPQAMSMEASIEKMEVHDFSDMSVRINIFLLFQYFYCEVLQITGIVFGVVDIVIGFLKIFE